MAELVGGAFLSTTLQVAFERLASCDITDYFRGSKLKDGLLKKLHITLVSINQVLEDAEEIQYRNQNVRQWLDELKDAVFKAEDLLDEIATEASRQKLKAELHPTTSKKNISNGARFIAHKNLQHGSCEGLKLQNGSNSSKKLAMHTSPRIFHF